MLTYTQLLERYKIMTKDKSSENVTSGSLAINSAIRKRLGEKDWIFLEKSRTATTVASQQAYTLPADYAQMRTVTVTEGTTVWPLVEAPSREFWDSLNLVTFESNIAQYYYIIGNQILLYPTPSENGNTITYNYKKKVGQNTVTDYTTGTLSITSGLTAITGSGTTFTSAMIGRSLQTTDGLWYEIDAYASATSIDLLQTYLGATVSGGTYTIGLLSPIPDAYEEMPVYDACTDYFVTQGNFEKASAYREMADELAKKMRIEQGSKSTSPRIRSGGSDVVNPNLFVTLP